MPKLKDGGYGTETDIQGKALLDALFLILMNQAVSKRLSNIKTTMTYMDMQYPTYDLQTAIIGYFASHVVYIHIGWGSVLLVFDKHAMPESLGWDK